MAKERIKYCRTTPIFKGWSLKTEMIYHTDEKVIFKTEAYDTKGTLRVAPPSMPRAAVNMSGEWRCLCIRHFPNHPPRTPIRIDQLESARQGSKDRSSRPMDGDRSALESISVGG